MFHSISRWALETGVLQVRAQGTRVHVRYDDGERHWADWEDGKWVDTAEVSGDEASDAEA